MINFSPTQVQLCRAEIWQSGHWSLQRSSQKVSCFAVSHCLSELIVTDFDNMQCLDFFPQVQSQHLSSLKAAALSGALPGRKGNYEAPSSGQKGTGGVLDLHRGEA